MNDTLRLQGATVSKLHGLGESTLRMRDGVVHQLQTLTEDGIALSGVFTDSTTIVRGDGVALGDEVFGGVTRRSTVTEKLRLGDAIIIRGLKAPDTQGEIDVQASESEPGSGRWFHQPGAASRLLMPLATT
jgi:hypothetical protein